MKSFLLISALVLGFISSAMPASASSAHLFVRHDVADYAAWRKVYDGFAATAREWGATEQGVYQSTDNANDVTVCHTFKTVAKAKAFGASAELKVAMQKAGVKGPAQIWYTTSTPGKSGKASHVRMFVQHDVADYAAWRKGYDGFAATRRKMGVSAQAVYRSADDPNSVVAYHDFKSVEKAKAFAASAELKAAMQGAGVKGAPQIWFVTRAAK